MMLTALLLITIVLAWPRKIRVPLSDGRVLVVDKLTRGPDHVSYAPFTLKTLWRTATTRWAWPNTTYHGDDGSVGIFYHSEPTHPDFTDHVYLVDVDGWWWEPIQQGHDRESGRLAVFPPMRLPPSPRFEVWTNGLRTGGVVLGIRPQAIPASRERRISPLPAQQQRGETLVIVHGIDVTTRDDVRPSECEVHLRIEAFLAGKPVRATLGEVLVTNGEGRGNQRVPDADGRFRTTLSPHAPYWTIQLSIMQDPPDETAPEAPIEIDLVIRPQVSGTVPGARKSPGARPEL